MNIIKTDFPGLMIIEPKVFADSRGYFFESYSLSSFENNGLAYNWVQDNESKSNFGVVRGLHYQLNPFSQAKLVRVIAGEVLDVVVDIRKGSPTFGQKFEIILSAENKRQLLIPRGFAHGFSVLKDGTIFSYKCDNVYNKESEGGIHVFDETLAIDWRIPKESAIVSEKDIASPQIANAKNNFEF
jgi:dTDP-4-dehydrorhamnose 3,5-epimerase